VVAADCGGIVMTGYDSYTDSGVDFLGKLPQSWHVTRIANVFEERNIVDNPAEELLSIDRHRGIIKQSETGRKIRAPQDRNGYKLIEPGQLGYNILNAFMGAIGISRYRGIISPAYAVARFREEQSPWFFHYLLRTHLYQQQFNRFSYGIMYERNRLYFERFKTIPIPVPPLAEQEKIAHYLRTQDAKIARFIRIKRELIARLNEQKLRLIDHAVTGRLDTIAQRKPSGVAWLGEVPGHWEVLRLKFLASNITNQTTSKTDNEIYLALEHVQSWTGIVHLPEGEIEFASTVKRFNADDVLFGKLRPYLAKVTRSNRSGVCVSEFLVLRSNKNQILPAYLEQLLRCKRVIDLINSSTEGAKMPRADWDFIGNVQLPVPGKEEQHAILTHIKTKTEPLTTAIHQSEQEITLIREYRERLIADAVTGQIDLRGWQPSADDPINDDGLLALADPDTTRLDEEEDSA